VPRAFSTLRRRARPPSGLRVVRPRTARVQLNDLFTLFPELPRFRHRPFVDQLRRVRENIDRMQRRAKESVARHRVAAARVKASWLAKRRG
jgi:hypothetical protein